MFENVKNYLIIKNEDTTEEHLGKIIEIEKKNRKIKLQLVDENKNIYYRRERTLDIMVPMETELYCFKSSVLFYDIIEKIMTIEYPAEVSKVIKRNHRRYDINVALDILLGDHIIPAITYDIGLGGIGFLINNSYYLENDIIIKIKAEDFNVDYLHIKILNKREFRYKGKDYLLYGSEFIELKTDQFDKLVLFFNTLEAENLHGTILHS